MRVKVSEIEGMFASTYDAGRRLYERIQRRFPRGETT